MEVWNTGYHTSTGYSEYAPTEFELFAERKRVSAGHSLLTRTAAQHLSTARGLVPTMLRQERDYDDAFERRWSAKADGRYHVSPRAYVGISAGIGAAVFLISCIPTAIAYRYSRLRQQRTLFFIPPYAGLLGTVLGLGMAPPIMPPNPGEPPVLRSQYDEAYQAAFQEMFDRFNSLNQYNPLQHGGAGINPYLDLGNIRDHLKSCGFTHQDANEITCALLHPSCRMAWGLGQPPIQDALPPPFNPEAE